MSSKYLVLSAGLLLAACQAPMSSSGVLPAQVAQIPTQLDGAASPAIASPASYLSETASTAPVRTTPETDQSKPAPTTLLVATPKTGAPGREGIERTIERIMIAAAPFCGRSPQDAALSQNTLKGIGFSATFPKIDVVAPGGPSLRLAAGDSPPAKCVYPIVIEQTAQVMASSNGVRIRVTTAFLDQLQSDAEVAFIISHELGHLIRGHSAFFAPAIRQQQELDADQFGLLVMARAGYDPAAAVVLMDRLAQTNLFAAKDPNYPSFDARAELIRRSAVEIALSVAAEKKASASSRLRGAKIATRRD